MLIQYTPLIAEKMGVAPEMIFRFTQVLNLVGMQEREYSDLETHGRVTQSQKGAISGPINGTYSNKKNTF